MHKQAYLEFLERREHQQAFQYLTKRLKPLENNIPPVRPVAPLFFFHVSSWPRAMLAD